MKLMWIRMLPNYITKAMLKAVIIFFGIVTMGNCFTVVKIYYQHDNINVIFAALNFILFSFYYH